MAGSRTDAQRLGTLAALLTPLFMGLSPVFGKLAMRSGLDPYTLTALRTGCAALLLWGGCLLFFRRYLYVFPAGLMGAAAVGVVNGLGSLLFYTGLLLLDDASLAQLLNMTYVIFAVLLVRAYGQRVSWVSIGRALLALGGVYLLSVAHHSVTIVHWLGVALMLGSAFTYALHVVVSQRVMYEMPAPTMTLYAMTFMALTVLVARLVAGASLPLAWSPLVAEGWWFVAGLALVTALSRVTLFVGVRSLGGLQTILLNVAEVGVTLLAGFLWLGERLAPLQWLGVAVLMGSVLLAPLDARRGGPRQPAHEDSAARLQREPGANLADLPPGFLGGARQPEPGVAEPEQAPGAGT